MLVMYDCVQYSWVNWIQKKSMKQEPEPKFSIVQDYSSKINHQSIKKDAEKQQIQKLNNSDQAIDDLHSQIRKLEIQNKRLRSRLADFEPHKQRLLREPNKIKTKQLFSKFKTKKFALKICYLGWTYDGMAYQQDFDNTVEAYIFKAMHTLSLIENQTPGSVDYTRAGRTDKGVSAMGNVISLKLRTNQPIQQELQPKQYKPIQYCEMLNSILPDDIRILACEQVEQQFNARYWCVKRSYKYFFRLSAGMDIEAMKKGIAYLQGTHNFLNFCKINLTNTVNFERTIFLADIRKAYETSNSEHNQDIYYFYFVGNSFLWHQIRFMSSVLFMIGLNRQKPQIILELLDTNQYPRKPNYTMAPQYPLILEDCQYPNLKLIPTLKNTLEFENAFTEFIIKRNIENTLVQNCINMNRSDLFGMGLITENAYLNELAKSRLINLNRTKNNKKLGMYKASGRTLDQAVQSLKGKKKQQFEKKKKKQLEYQQKIKDKNQAEQLQIQIANRQQQYAEISEDAQNFDA